MSSVVDRVRQIIAVHVDRDLERLGESDPEDVTREVCRRFAHAIDGADTQAAEFWHHFGEHGVRALVNEHVRKLTNPLVRSRKRDPDPKQLAFPGFPLVQRAYSIRRERRPKIVRTDRLTWREAKTKAAELRKAGETLLEHADQLELFAEQRLRGAG